MRLQNYFLCKTTMRKVSTKWGAVSRLCACTYMWFLGVLETSRKTINDSVISVCPFACLFVCPSVRPFTWNNSVATGWIFMKLDIWVFRKYVEKIQVSLKCEQNNGYSTWIPVCIYPFIRVPRLTLLRMTNNSDKNCRENQNSNLCTKTSFRKSCLLWIMWKTGVESDRPQMPYDTAHPRCMLGN
jgi:hypothetical protein